MSTVLESLLLKLFVERRTIASLMIQSLSCKWYHDEYLKYSFYPYALVSFSSVFMLNMCPNALKVHTYDQVIHLVELYKIGGKTAIEAAGEATEF